MRVQQLRKAIEAHEARATELDRQLIEKQRSLATLTGFARIEPSARRAGLGIARSEQVAVVVPAAQAARGSAHPSPQQLLTSVARALLPSSALAEAPPRPRHRGPYRHVIRAERMNLPLGASPQGGGE